MTFHKFRSRCSDRKTIGIYHDIWEWAWSFDKVPSSSPILWVASHEKERKYYFPCIDVYFLVCPSTFSYAKLNERRQINHNLIDKPPIIFSEITEQKFSSKPSCLSWCKGKNGLAEEEDDLNKQHFNFTSSKYTVKQHWIIREQEAKWSSVYPDKIKINLMQLIIYNLYYIMQLIVEYF